MRGMLITDVMPAILAPFQYVAMHVVKAKIVGRKATYGSCFFSIGPRLTIAIDIAAVIVSTM